MAQFARPTSDVTNAWASGGWAEIDEVTPSDSDFAYTIDNPNSNLEVHLGDPTDPTVHTGHVVKWRHVLIDGGVAASSAGTGCDLTVTLVQGATSIASKALIALDTVTSWTEDSFTLTTGEAANITDYTDLRLRFAAKGGGGAPGDRRGAGVSWAVLEVPDATSDQTITPTAATLPLVAPSPTVSLGVLTLTPTAVTLPAIAPSPTVDRTLTLTPTAVAVPSVAPNATVSLGVLTLTPTAATLPLIAPTPTVLTGAIGYWSFAGGSSQYLVDTTVPTEISSQTQLTFLAAVRVSGTNGGSVICTAETSVHAFAGITIDGTNDEANMVTLDNALFKESAEGTLNQGSWDAIAGICDDGDPLVYLNGVVGNTDSGGSMADASNVVVGRNGVHASATFYLTGDVAAFAIVQGALSATDVDEWATGGSGGSILDPTLCSWATASDAYGRILAYWDCTSNSLTSTINSITTTLANQNSATFTSTGGPTVDKTGGLTLTPTAATLPLVAPSTTVSLGAITLTPSVAQISLVAPTPTVDLIKTVAPTPSTLPLIAPATTVSLGALTLTPDAASSTLIAPATSISLGVITLTPDPSSLPVVAPATTVDLGVLTATPDSVSLLVVAPAPTVSLGVLTLTPSTVQVPLVAPTPTVSLVATLSPGVAAISLVAPSTTVSLGVLTLTPSAAVLPISAPTPTVNVGSGPQTLTPSAAPLSLLTPASSIALGSLTLTPSTVTLPIAAPISSISLGALTLTPSAVALPLSAPVTTLLLGELALAPTAIALPLAAPGVTVDIELTISPDAVALPLSAPATTVTLGILTLTPSVATLPLVVSSVTVNVGSGPQTLTPTAVTTPLTAPAATVSLGALTLTPSVSTLPLISATVTVDLDLIETPSATALPIISPSVTVDLEAVTLAPDESSLSLVVPSVTISIGAKTITPTAVSVPAVAPSITVSLGAISITPLAVQVPVIALSVDVQIPVTLTPTAAQFTMLAPSAAVLKGSIEPDPAEVQITVPETSFAGSKVVKTWSAKLTIIVPSVALSEQTVNPDALPVELLLPPISLSTNFIVPSPCYIRFFIPAPSLVTPAFGVGVPLTVLGASNLQTFITAPLHRYTTLWEIERIDGMMLRFTDHDHPLVLDNEVDSYQLIATAGNTAQVQGLVANVLQAGDTFSIAGSSTDDGVYEAIFVGVHTDQLDTTEIQIADTFTGASSGSVRFFKKFRPSGGNNASARQQRTGLQSSNVETIGMLDSEAITDDDLRAGRYRNAKVTERLVDWRYPFAGNVRLNVYYIGEVTYGDGVWQAQLQGTARKFRNRVGRVFSRRCDWPALGDEYCKKDISASPFTQSNILIGSVDSSNPRKRFTLSTLTTQADGYYDDGVVTFTEGPNVGLTFEIHRYKSSNDEIVLWTQAPFDITAGERVTVVVGCDRIKDTCLTKFDNLDNFGGFPWMPGPDKVIRSPASRLET